MKRTQIAPTLAGLVAEVWDRRWGPAKRELAAITAVVRAAASDPDPHHRVEAALSRLRRLSAPRVSPGPSTVKGKSKLPANSPGATRKGGTR